MWRALGVGTAVVVAAGIGFAALAIGPAARAPEVAAASPEQVLARAAEDSLRRRLRNPPNLAFSDLRVVRFGPEDERAVCGKAGGVGFILRVLLPRDGSVPQERDGRGFAYTTVLEQGPGLPLMGGAVERFCREGGALVARAIGPAPSPDAAPAAPLSAQPVAAVQGSGPGSPMVSEAAGAVQVRSNANLRAAPVGGSEVLGVLPQGSALRAFARAPGGWVQVGDASPQGWVHSSLLSGAN
ncbi:SH3 domain-containing protein [Belnapia sp. T18]|uniref:SH3 domain-containing protein n=1 Tax=Belnapia arida TaxID=2804533 RepID=A0ABS1U0Z5_9PROT|nr:SH3 domain-containing protein [Belnapia arida]MBL6078349.1 SH3 domain-containing protein [Belnapia arida]